MKQAVVVGQDHADKCLIAKFDGTNWAVDTSFPSITGRLWGVYSYSMNNLWVCGGTGTTGVTAPILYHYSNGSWIDHSSDLSDCVYLSKIDGNGPNNIWTCGKATGAIITGAWQWNGTSWTSTKVNTAALSDTLYHYTMHLSVSPEGTCYIPYMIDGIWGTLAERIRSNKTVVGFSEFFYSTNIGGGRCRNIKAFSDSSIILSNKGTNDTNGYAVIYFDGTWHYKGRTYWGAADACLFMDALDTTHFYYKSVGDQLKFYENNNQANSTTIGSDAIFQVSIGEIAALADDDIWVAGGFYGSNPDYWGYTGVDTDVPWLSHWEGSLTWSAQTAYNANGLYAKAWYDIKGYQVAFQDPIPCNVDYIDPDYTLNHYICHPTQRKATDGQRVVVAPFSIANPSIKIRRK